MNTNKNVAFIITIPIWDKHTKNNNLQNVTKNYNINTKANDHIDYSIYFLLKPYIKIELVIPKHRIPYFNHRLHKPIYAVDTYMLFVYHNIDNQYTNPFYSIFDSIIELDKKDYFII